MRKDFFCVNITRLTVYIHSRCNKHTYEFSKGAVLEVFEVCKDKKYVKENNLKTGGIINERYFNEAVT